MIFPKLKALVVLTCGSALMGVGVLRAQPSERGRSLASSETSRLFGGANAQRTCGPINGCGTADGPCLGGALTCPMITKRTPVAGANTKACNVFDENSKSCTETVPLIDCNIEYKCGWNGVMMTCGVGQVIKTTTRAPTNCTTP